MDRTEVSSSNILSVGYDSESQTLEIEFVKGAVYQYFDVPEHVYDSLIAAQSVGTFFNTQIKGLFRYAKL